MVEIRVLSTLIVAVALVSLVPGTGVAGEDAAAVLRGYDQAYNLDHAEAVATLQAAIAADPDDPAAHRGLAAVTWMRILFLRGSMTVDDYLGGFNPNPVDLPDPPAELARMFETHSSRAVELSEALADAAPDDADAQYELGASLALAASYMATVEGEPLAALEPARTAYTAHERVLELDPQRADAKLVVGTYRYLVSTLPLPVRMLARLVGFGASREEGIRLIREAAEHGSETAAEARFGLVLIYNREGRFGAAQRVLRDLGRRFPRNRLVWLEAAATALRDDRPGLALARLQDGFDRLETESRPRMFGEAALWRYMRGATLLRLDRDAAAQADLLAALEHDARLWVRGRAHIELGKLADLSGDRALATDYYDRGEVLCDDGRDRRGVEAAQRLQREPYRRR